MFLFPPPHPGVLVSLAAPEGVAPPSVESVTARTASVAFTAPAQSNGIITAYNIVLNGTVVQTVASAANVVSLESLEPFSPYVVAIQACTGMAQIILLPRSIHTHMHTRTNIMSRPGLAQTLHARPPTVCRLRRARMRLTPSQRQS